MANLKVLENIKCVLIHFGLYPQSLTGTYSAMKSLIGFHLLFVIFSGFLISSSMFVYQNLQELELALETSLIVIAGLHICGMVLSIRLNLDEVKIVHLTLQEIVDKSMRI